MDVKQVNENTVKIRTSKAAVAAVSKQPFQTEAGSVVTVNGNILNPIGGPWYWLGAFPRPDAEARILRDLEVLEVAEAEFKRKVK